MKKLLLLFISTLLFISCSDESDNNVDVNQSDLVGTWNLTKLEGFNKADVKSGVFSTNIDNTFFGKDYNFTFNFTENPNNYYTDGSFTLVTIDKDDQTTEISSNTAGNLVSGEWKIENNKLVITNKTTQASTEFTIDSFETNKLTLKETINLDQSNDHGTSKINSSLIMILEK